MKTTVRSLRKMNESIKLFNQFMSVHPVVLGKVNDPNTPDDEILELPDENLELLKFKIAFEPDMGTSLNEKEFNGYLDEKFKTIRYGSNAAKGLPKELRYPGEKNVD